MATARRARIDALFQQGGPLYGKMHIIYPIRRAYPDGRIYDLKQFTKGRTRKEEAGMLALIHELGWPDRSPQEVKVDALYLALKLAFEFDETQARGRRVNLYYTQRGFYVVRIRCADPVPDASCDATDMRWIPMENREVVLRTRQAVRQVLLLKQEQMEQNHDYRGKLMVWPDLPDRHLAEGIFRATEINNAAPNATDPMEQSLRRGTILGQQLAMQAAREFDAEQQRRTKVEEDGDSSEEENTGPPMEAVVLHTHMENELQVTVALISRTICLRSHLDSGIDLSGGGDSSLPKTKASGLSFPSIAECLGGSSAATTATTTQYERKWKALMQSYSPQNTYEERVRRITLEVAEFARKYQ